MSQTDRAAGDLELLSTTEVAEMLEISPSAVRKLIARGRFPRPDVIIANHRVWRRVTVHTYQVNQRRGRGRPRKSAQLNTS